MNLKLISYLHLIIFFLFSNLLLACGAYLYYLNSIEAIITSARLLASAICVFFLCTRINRNVVIKFVVYFSGINGALIGLQVFEQVASLSFLPDILKYGGLWGFAETHDYEIFKKGGIFPTTQTPSILGLFSAYYIVSNKKFSWLLIPNIVSIIFGGRTTLILLIVIVAITLLNWSLKTCRNPRIRINITAKLVLTRLVYVCLAIWLIVTWVGSDIGGHHALRIMQVVDVVFTLDLTGGESGGGAFQYFRYPNSSLEALIGNGYPRFHPLGGNDPLYSRWMLQSGILALFLILMVFFICFIVERKHTQSAGMIIVLLLIQALKGDVITSVVFFDIYLLYLFSNRPVGWGKGIR